jgi:glucan 1,3-beta-glucosidase
MPSISTSAIALLPFVVSAVSAAGTLGFALGDKKTDGTCKFQADYEADFKTISSSGSKLVRVYAASDCDTAKQILPAAKSSGFQVVLGIWYVLSPFLADTDVHLAED